MSDQTEEPQANDDWVPAVLSSGFSVHRADSRVLDRLKFCPSCQQPMVRHQRDSIGEGLVRYGCPTA